MPDHSLLSDLKHTEEPFPGRGTATMPPRNYDQKAAIDPGGHVSIVEPEFPVDVTGLPLSPKKVFKAAETMGFTVRPTQGHIYVSPTLRLAASEAGEAGSILYDEKYVTWTRLIGYRADAKVAFDATWADGKFQSVFIIDPMGMPKENYFDYSYDKNEIKAGANPQRAKERGWDYNDGTDRIEHRFMLSTSTEFFQWVDDYLRIWAPQVKPLTPKRKTREEKVQEQTASLIAGEGWEA